MTTSTLQIRSLANSTFCKCVLFANEILWQMLLCKCNIFAFFLLANGKMSHILAFFCSSCKSSHLPTCLQVALCCLWFLQTKILFANPTKKNVSSAKLVGK